MKERLNSSNKKLTNGPGILAKSMGITTKFTGSALGHGAIWIEDATPISKDLIVETTRIGVEYAEEDALLPWRFYRRYNSWVRKK